MNFSIKNLSQYPQRIGICGSSFDENEITVQEHLDILSRALEEKF
jgi:hypothetical protein